MSADDALAQHDYGDLGIEGLTVVLYMRGEHDLVVEPDFEKEPHGCE